MKFDVKEAELEGHTRTYDKSSVPHIVLIECHTGLLLHRAVQLLGDSVRACPIKRLQLRRQEGKLHVFSLKICTHNTGNYTHIQPNTHASNH